MEICNTEKHFYIPYNSVSEEFSMTRLLSERLLTLTPLAFSGVREAEWNGGCLCSVCDNAQFSAALSGSRQRHAAILGDNSEIAR